MGFERDTTAPYSTRPPLPLTCLGDSQGKHRCCHNGHGAFRSPVLCAQVPYRTLTLAREEGCRR